MALIPSSFVPSLAKMHPVTTPSQIKYKPPEISNYPDLISDTTASASKGNSEQLWVQGSRVEQKGGGSEVPNVSSLQVSFAMSKAVPEIVDGETEPRAGWWGIT